MSSTWLTRQLKDVAAPEKNALVGGPFGSNLVSSDYVPVGVPVIRGQNMTSGRWVGGDFAFVTRQKADSLACNVARPGDLVFTQRGTLGQVAIVPEGSFDRYLLSQSQMKLTVNPSQADAKFLYYVFCSQEQYEYIRANAIQTGVPHTNLRMLRETPVALPPIDVQRAIVGVLGALDDKVELNRRMNETLESMARTIFKSWFVDFDPVRAKAEGRQPAGMDAETAALFPDSFDESDEERPAGWSAGRFLDIAELLSGGTPKTSEPVYWNGDVPWASAQDVSQCGSPFLITTSRTITSRGIEESATQLIPALSTVVVARGATTGRHAMFGRQMAMNQTCYGLKAKAGDDYFLYCLFGSEVDGLVNAAHGSVFDTITTSTFRSSELVAAPVEIRLRFNALTAPLFERILANLEESRTLAALRDALLPKLLSGGMRVHPVEGAVPANA